MKGWLSPMRRFLLVLYRRMGEDRVPARADSLVNALYNRQGVGGAGVCQVGASGYDAFVGKSRQSATPKLVTFVELR